MIEITKRRLKIDGKIVAERDDCPVEWGERVHGRVLEIGLGMGLLWRAIERQRRAIDRLRESGVDRWKPIDLHVCVEQDERLIDYVKFGLYQEYPDRRGYIMHGRFPTSWPLHLCEPTWDCVLLDIETTPWLEETALGLLADRGMLFVRR